MISQTGPGVVVFDGGCGICNAARKWIEARDHSGGISFVAYQTADLDRLSPGLTRRAAGRSVFYVYPDGRRVGGARAVFETLRQLPGMWGIIGRVMARPPFWLLAEPFYYLVARNRAHLSVWLGLDYCPVELRSTPLRGSDDEEHPGTSGSSLSTHYSALSLVR